MALFKPDTEKIREIRKSFFISTYIRKTKNALVVLRGCITGYPTFSKKGKEDRKQISCMMVRSIDLFKEAYFQLNPQIQRALKRYKWRCYLYRSSIPEIEIIDTLWSSLFPNLIRDLIEIKPEFANFEEKNSFTERGLHLLEATNSYLKSAEELIDKMRDNRPQFMTKEELKELDRKAPLAFPFGGEV